jgi:hypothetical protein
MWRTTEIDDDGSIFHELEDIGSGTRHYVVTLATDGFLDIDRYTDLAQAEAAFAWFVANLSPDPVEE